MTEPEDYYRRRAYVILDSMAQENRRAWWEFWVPRWTTPDEPLRAQARNLLEEMREWEQTRGR